MHHLCPSANLCISIDILTNNHFLMKLFRLFIKRSKNCTELDDRIGCLTCSCRLHIKEKYFFHPTTIGKPDLVYREKLIYIVIYLRIDIVFHMKHITQAELPWHICDRIDNAPLAHLFQEGKGKRKKVLVIGESPALNGWILS